jgi:hypothetical protein
MLEWMVANHDVVRDLATPVVTIVVGLVALAVQLHFNRKQTTVAEDKLKFDLFEKRFAIYSAANEIIAFANSSKEVPGEENKFYELYSLLEQAPFFFDAKACEYFKEVLSLSQRLLELINAEDSVEVRTKVRDTRITLSRLYVELPMRAGHALRFEQLTR